jgi:acetyltransferase-like isoleucine patch superfamily enzyme
MILLKLFIINFFKFIGQLFSFFFPFKLSSFFLFFRNLIFTGWISSSLKSCGKDSIFYPFSLVGGKKISFGRNCSVGYKSSISAWELHNGIEFNPEITIGNNVSIGAFSHITSMNKIIIGNNVLTGKFVTITDNSHGISELESIIIPPSNRLLHSNGPVIIRDGVWIGDKVTILPNLTIGKNSIIASNSVVTKSVPDNCIVAGVPSKIIKKM